MLNGVWMEDNVRVDEEEVSVIRCQELLNGVVLDGRDSPDIALVPLVRVARAVVLRLRLWQIGDVLWPNDLGIVLQQQLTRIDVDVVIEVQAAKLPPETFMRLHSKIQRLRIQPDWRE